MSIFVIDCNLSIVTDYGLYLYMLMIDHNISIITNHDLYKLIIRLQIINFYPN